MSSSRADNVSVAAAGPAPSQHVPAASTTTCEALSDAEWVAQRYDNFRAFVHSLVAQEPKLAEWADWLTTIPLAVFLAGGDQELKGVREATTDEQRAVAAGLVLDRWALDYVFDLEKITAADQKKLRRYIQLFATC